MRAREMKDAVYGQFARLGKAIAAPKRFELLELLCQGPLTVEQLARETALSVANASQHLQVLRRSRLVEAEKRGLYVTYRLAGDDLLRFIQAARGLATERYREIADVTETYLRSRGALERVDGTELLRRVRRGDVTVLDVRPESEYRAGHIPGARSIPLAELRRRAAELPRSREIVAYCRGPHCVMAIEAVEWLCRQGFRARRMEQGVMEWRARGWRLEKAEKR